MSLNLRWATICWNSSVQQSPCSQSLAEWQHAYNYYIWHCLCYNNPQSQHNSSVERFCPSQHYRRLKNCIKDLVSRLLKKVTQRTGHKTCPLWILLVTPLQPGNSPLSTACHSLLFSQLLICQSQLLIIPVLICTISTLNSNFLGELYWLNAPYKSR